MPKYRKKPAVIEAVQWTGANTEEIAAFCNIAVFYYKDAVWRIGDPIVTVSLTIPTLEGEHMASIGD